MDVLSDVLEHLCLESELIVQPRLFAPWGLAMDGGVDALFHLVLAGGAFLGVEGADEPIELGPGDFVLLPHGHAHRLTDTPGGATRSAARLRNGQTDEELARMRVGGSGRETILVSGRYRFRRQGVHPLLSTLPPAVRLCSTEGWRGPWLLNGVQLLDAELAGGRVASRAGSRELVRRLLEVLFLQAVRCHVEDGRARDGDWLQSLRDPALATALGCIHREPGENWTTARLAEAAGMPRAPFAALFTRRVGEPPPRYLTRWRIQTALATLRRPHPPLAQVAQEAGYPTTAAFTRLFKRMVGMPPAEYRRALLAGEEPLERGERPQHAGRHHRRTGGRVAAPRAGSRPKRSERARA